MFSLSQTLGKLQNPKMNDEAKPSVSSTKTLSKAIDQMGSKWNSYDIVRNMVQDTCSSKRSPLHSKSLTIHHISVALLWLLTAPTITGFFCICANSNFYFGLTLNSLFEQEECIVTKPKWLANHLITIPTANCHSMCQGITEVPALAKISSLEFLAKYAYSGRPLIIRNATDGWQAMEKFEFNFLKRIFQSHAENLVAISFIASKSNTKLSPENAKLLDTCRFFPFNTDARNLAEFLNISKTKFVEGNYYVGWSNCFPEVLNQLHSQYSWPDFLPTDSEASKIDWIFMGASHEKDFINRPYLQAVITGAKNWTLYPPAECENVCLSKYEVHIAKGDLIIFDTNLWYHRIKTHPGVFIALGTEFD